MKIATIGMEKGMQWRYTCQKRSRILCVRVIPEIVNDGHSQVADTGQEHNDREYEKPCQWVGQQVRNHHVLLRADRKIAVWMNAFVEYEGHLELDQ